ncbi:MAG: hypothetical protein NC928_02345 [Candidatus Omnitrophica bacterium]|nr:hypothetical protein [Candidatus Omnitrophota bacterium]
MEKKESPNQEIKKEPRVLPKVTIFSGKIFSIIKFIFGLCLLPLVYASSISFLNEFSGLDKSSQNNFWAGLITLLIIYLFIWEPTIIYVKGQKILEIIFSFFKPLVRVAPYVLPVYTLILFFGYWAVSFISKSPKVLNYFLFLFGFSMGLHLIFGAKSLRTRQQDFLKANYIFGFSFVYILNLILTALILNFIFAQFSIVNFLNNSFRSTQGIFYAVFKQLFLSQ